jgi:hypothetical protein
MSEQTRRIAEGILDRLNVSTEDFAALNAHLHSEHAAGFTAGLLAGLRYVRYQKEYDKLTCIGDIDDWIAHVEATGGLREEA